jgi:hypothetical protein
MDGMFTVFIIILTLLMLISIMGGSIFPSSTERFRSMDASRLLKQPFDSWNTSFRERFEDLDVVDDGMFPENITEEEREDDMMEEDGEFVNDSDDEDFTPVTKYDPSTDPANAETMENEVDEDNNVDAETPDESFSRSEDYDDGSFAYSLDHTNHTNHTNHHHGVSSTDKTPLGSSVSKSTIEHFADVEGQYDHTNGYGSLNDGQDDDCTTTELFHGGGPNNDYIAHDFYAYSGNGGGGHAHVGGNDSVVFEGFPGGMYAAYAPTALKCR